MKAGRTTPGSEPGQPFSAQKSGGSGLDTYSKVVAMYPSEMLLASFKPRGRAPMTGCWQGVAMAYTVILDHGNLPGAS
jgi:hypothetical protein